MTRKVEAKPGLLGDLNNDGAITWADYNTLESYIVNQGTVVGEAIITESGLPREEFLRRADVNSDGKINAVDLVALEILLEEVPPERSVTITLKNPPTGAEHWNMSVMDWDFTESVQWTKERDNIGDSAVFEIPEGWKFPLTIVLQILKWKPETNETVLQQLYYVQSYREEVWGEPAPWYKEIFIPDYGSYRFNVATEQFERV
ncbi:hypothetical protein ES703_108134 [subsurface metagenome]